MPTILSNIQEVDSSDVGPGDTPKEGEVVVPQTELATRGGSSREGVRSVIAESSRRGSTKRSRLCDSQISEEESHSVVPGTEDSSFSRRSAQPGLESPGTTAIDTPCPRPTRPGRLALAPIVNNRARPSKATTMDIYTEGQGGYAEAEALPVDPEKKQRQQEAFRAVTPITGRGPYSYYTNSEYTP